MEQYYKKYEQRYQAVYAAGADMWGYVPENEDLNKILAEWVERQNLTGRTVLETCCGEGGAGVILSKLGCKYRGVDIAPSALKTAERLLVPYENASVALVDLVEDELQGQYDAAFDAMGFHMLLTDCDRKAYLENVYRALKPGAPMLFFRESYRENEYEGEVNSYEHWLEIAGEDFVGSVKKYAKKGTEKVEVMIPRMPGRQRNERGYRKELEAAGFIVDDFQVECGWNGWRPFASIWVHKPDCGKV